MLQGVLNGAMNTPGLLQAALRGGRPHRTKIPPECANKYSIGATGTETTVCTITGSGCIKKIWLTNTTANLTFFARLKVYVDGEATASINLELGTSFMVVGGTDLNRDAHTENWEGSYRSGGLMRGVLHLPIPYSNGVVIKMENPSDASGGSAIGTGSYFFVNVEYTDEITSPLRLKSSQANWFTTAQVIYTATYDFMSVAAGKSGWLAFHNIAVDASTDLSAWERNYQFYDGATKIAETSGSEDFFLGAYYFWSDVPGGHTPPTNFRDWSYIYRSTTSTDYDGLRIMAARDLLASGGWKFNNGATLRWNNDGQIVGHTSFVRHTTLWYEG